MSGLDRYRLLAQLGAGRDGIAYRAERVESGDEVEVRVLASARSDPARWPMIVKRLGLLARLQHRSARRLLEVDLGSDPPFVALERETRPSLDASMANRGPVTPIEAIGLAHAVSAGLASAHRLGLIHGALEPGDIAGDDPETITLDFSGLDTTPDAGAPRVGFVAPETTPGSSPTAEADVYALGALSSWLMTGGEPPHALLELVGRMLANDPDDRPTATSAERELGAILCGMRPDSLSGGNWGLSLPSRSVDETSDFSSTAASRTIERSPFPHSAPFDGLRLAGASAAGASSSLGPERLGRFRLIEKLGEGGMGEVYKAEDEADGSLAAVKLLRREVASRPNALQRFRKEARLLAQVRNPYVTHLLEVNEDSGIHYIVLEYVAGRSLDRELDERGKLDETSALAIAADVARGLMDAHRLGIVHRDVKPANILLVGKLPQPLDSRSRQSASISKSKVLLPRVKLSDFGLARHTEQVDTQSITQAGVVVGTPTYMSPEQCAGGKIDARSDVYSLGVTLFHLVAGRPPFQADDWHGVINKHMNELPPSLTTLNLEVSEGFCHVVEKALSKTPERRYADASAMLDDLERLLRGEPTGLPMHPILPEGDAKDVLRFDFVWELDASPRSLWPHVSNTDRLDRAIGFGAVRYSLKFDPARGVRRFLEGQKAGMPEEGEEHPYEWIEGRRLGVFREYEKGPFHWVVSIVELTPRAGGGTTLAHRLRLVPRGRLIRLGAKWGVGSGLRKELEKVYLRIDAAVTGKLGPVRSVDPFESAPPLDPARRRRLDERLTLLMERGIDSSVVEALGSFLAESPAPELSRIRPIELARRLGLPEEAVIAACLEGANAGLLVLLWDLLCPVCRIPSEVKETLRALTDHGRCEACNLDFELDFANSVELIFQANPEIREADVNTYCASGPAHSRHVVAQVRVHPGERFELDLDLTPGAYRLAGPQLGWTLDFQVRQGAPSRRWDLSLIEGPTAGLSPHLGPGGQVLALTNESDRELLIRIERTAPRDDALTAARASSLAIFRELFPAEVLAPGRLVSISNVTLLVTALDSPTSLYETIGDARAFAVLHEQFRLLDEVVRREGGAVVKTLGEGVLAAFPDADAAVRAGMQFPEALRAGELTRGLRLQLAAHRGPAMAATLNDHLDYFGTTVNQTMQALARSRGGLFVLSRAVASDPDVSARMMRSGRIGTVLDEDSSVVPFGPLVGIAIDPAESLSPQTGLTPPVKRSMVRS